MARFGLWKPLADNWASQPKMSADIISLHTAVGSLASTDAYFRKTGYSGSHSHFGVGAYGECWQWQDTAYRAAANYAGNYHIISVETADRGDGFTTWNINDGSAVPAWRPEQIETLAMLVASMCNAHSIPCVLIPDAKPGRRGIGYHRQGVPGYMVAGAEQWSTATGKVCPGNRRIAQIPQVIARAQQLLNAPVMETPEDDLTAQFETDVRADLAAKQKQLNTIVEQLTGGGHTLNADLRGDLQAKGQQLISLTAANSALTQLVASQNGLTVADVEAAVERAVAKGVQVDVAVGPSVNVARG